MSETVCDPEYQNHHSGTVDRLAAEFDVIGVTERLSESLECFLDAVGRNMRSLLARVKRNASPRLDPTEVTSEDRAFLIERNQLDLALHVITADRLDGALRARG